MKKQMERKGAESEASSEDIVVDVDDVDEGLNVRSLVQTCVSEAFETIERLIACGHGDEGRMFLCGKAQGHGLRAAVDLAFSSNLHLRCSSRNMTFDTGWGPTAELGTRA